MSGVRSPYQELSPRFELNVIRNDQMQVTVASRMEGPCKKRTELKSYMERKRVTVVLIVWC